MYQGSIQEWINSAELKSIQNNILQGRVDPGCEWCLAGEAKDQSGTRLSALRDYGTVDAETAIDYIDYRASNICNFKCRSCDPFYSNGIAQESRRNPELQTFYVLPKDKLAPTTQQDKAWILDNLPNLKRLMFTGGEPTKIPEVKEILNHIRQTKQFHVAVQITSNASFTDPYWTEITTQIPNIHWTLSVDSVGSAAEIIRHGTDWSIVSHNIELMFDISPSVNIGTVVTNLSLTQLDLLFAFANSMERRYRHRANGRTQFIEICNWPRYLSPYNWPDQSRPEILEYLRGIVINDDLQEKQRQITETLIKNIEQVPFDAEIWQEFTKYNSLLDSVRKEDYTQLLRVH